MSTEVGSLQASLSLDIREFSSGVKEAAQVARSLGQTLREALGNSSQGFSAIQRSVIELREEVTRLKAEVASFNAQLNMSNSPEAFTQVQQYTSRLKGDLQEAANAATQFAANAGGAETAMSGVQAGASNAYAVVDMATGEVMEMASSAQAASAAMTRLSGEAQDAAGGAKETADATGATANNTKQAANSANKLDAAGKKAAGSFRRVESTVNNVHTLALDIKRIISGIVISQAFYELLNVVNQLVAGSIQFANNMDQAGIAFKYLLGNQQDASNMITSLQDFAIQSPLDTSQVMDATRKLMAMGFTAKSVIPTLQIMADTASVFTSESGDMSEMLSAITLALGQMRASGKIMGQEMRQLYNAGIPVFQILQEELGLTAAQVRNIGKLGVDSTTGVIAILKGLQKRYAGAAEEFTKTIPGALAVVKDSIYVLYNMLGQKPHNAIKTWVNEVANSLQALVVITRAYGPGGFMQAIFPPWMHEAIRRLVGSLGQLGSAFKAVAIIIKDLFGNAIHYIGWVLSWILPPLTTLINVIARVALIAYQCIPGLKQLLAVLAAYVIVYSISKLFMLLWKVMKLGAIVGFVKSAFIGLISTIKKLIVWLAALKAATLGAILVIAALLAIIAAIAMNSDRARASIKRLTDSFKKLGMGFDTGDILQPDFKAPSADADQFYGGLEDIVGAEDDVGAAADKAGKKIKQAFNQSFDEVFLIDPSSSDASGAIDDAMNMADVLGDLQDIMAGGLGGDGLTGDFWDDWGNIQDDFGLGGGMDFGGMANDFWSALVEAFAAPEWVGAGLGAAIGGLLGLLIGGPGGALIGAAIGGLVGWIAGLFWPELKEALGLTDTQGISIAIGGGIGAAIGYLVGGPVGALIGTAIGSLVGWITGMLIDGFQTGNWDWSRLGLGIGTGIGAAIGMIAGGPLGAAIGAAIGALVGWLAGLIADNWDSITAWFTQMGTTIGTWCSETWAAFTAWLGSVWSGFTTWCDGVWTGFTTWLSNLGTSIATWCSNVWTSFLTWLTTTGTNIATWWNNLITNIGTWLSNIWTKFTTWFTNLITGIGSWLGGIWNSISTWFTNLLSSIGNWLGNIWGKITGWFSQVISGFSSWIGNLWNTITQGINNIYNTFTNWISNLWSNVFGKLFGWIDDGIDKLKKFLGFGDQASKISAAGDASRTVGADFGVGPLPDITSASPMSGLGISGHAKGGIFNKEHIANFAEGNKAEAIIPLENANAMQPFVNAISDGIIQSLMPLVSTLMQSNNNTMQPLYVGTLIADDRSLKELNRRMNVIQLQENKRRGE